MGRALFLLGSRCYSIENTRTHLHAITPAVSVSVSLHFQEVTKLPRFACRISAGSGHWTHTTDVPSTGRREAWWHLDPLHDPWTPQVCSSVSLGPPLRAGPRHPDLSRGGAHTAPCRAPCPPAEDTALLCVHQMWQGVLGRLSLRPRPLHVPGGLTYNRWGHWYCCSRTTELTDTELMQFTKKTSRIIHTPPIQLPHRLH